MLANAAALMSAELLNQHLQETLATRDVIGQAKGILMLRHGIGAEEAFTILRQTSQDSHRKLHDVAVEVVTELQWPPRAALDQVAGASEQAEAVTLARPSQLSRTLAQAAVSYERAGLALLAAGDTRRCSLEQLACVSDGLGGPDDSKEGS